MNTKAEHLEESENEAMEQYEAAPAADEAVNNDHEPKAESNDVPSVEEQLAKLQDEHLRLRAEYDNYRKRTLKEKSELIRNGAERSMIDLLPVVDDLELAIKNIEQVEEVSAVKDGIALIYTRFQDYLKKQGIARIETENKPFDEQFCEAIAVIPAPTEEAKGMIIDCVKTGYMLNDKVIRHANVVVGQ